MDEEKRIIKEVRKGKQNRGEVRRRNKKNN
jgi:hypothetical protein